jgi:hypothetical protein
LSQQQRSAAAAQFVAAPRRPQRRPWCKNLRRWSPCTCSRTGSARSETCTRADGGEAAVMRRGGPEDTRAASGRGPDAEDGAAHAHQRGLADAGVAKDHYLLQPFERHPGAKFT